MNRFETELRRLYGQHTAGLQDTDGGVRVMVLALGRPAEWASLLVVWQGVQADLGWPAPAIVVNGVDGYQLWFSLAEPVSPQQATEMLRALSARYLGHLKPERLGGWPLDLACRLPAQEVAPGQWSAFLAQDLASLFVDAPWLDLPPSPQAQADLLQPLKSIALAEWQRALDVPRPPAIGQPDRPSSAPFSAPSSAPSSAPFCAMPSRIGPHTDPRAFLLAVMNDPDTALPLRIEAAKALLPR